MTLRLRSYFQGEGAATGADWDDVFDSVPMLKSETADGSAAVAGYVDTTTNWANATAKLWSFRNNGVEKAYVDRGGKVVASSFDGNGSALTSLAASAVATGTLAAARGGTGVDGSAAANGKLLIGNGGGFALATLTAGSGVTITNGAGTISISAAALATPVNPDRSYQFNDAGSFNAATLYETGTGVVGFGGMTASEPGLFASTTTLQVVLADGSTFTAIQASKLLITTNVVLTQQGAGVLQLGDDASATPVSQVLQVQGARAGTDTNTEGGSLDIKAGQGTGGGTASRIHFWVPTPGASGTTAQTMVEVAVMRYDAVTTFTKLQTQMGTITAQNYAHYASATWNEGSTVFTLFACDVTNTASAAGSLLVDYRVGAATMFSVGVTGIVNAKTSYSVNGLQVLGARITGWAAATGTKSKATFDTTTVNLPQLAARFGQALDDLMTHGAFGA